MAYFNVGPGDSKPSKSVFNRTVTQRDTWGKIDKKSGGEVEYFREIVEATLEALNASGCVEIQDEKIKIIEFGGQYVSR